MATYSTADATTVTDDIERFRKRARQNGELVPESVATLIADYEELKATVADVAGDAAFGSLAGGVQTRVTAADTDR